MRISKYKQALLAVLLIAELFVVSVVPASAGMFGGGGGGFGGGGFPGGGGAPGSPGGGMAMPSATSFATEMETRYHVNSESLQEQGEMLNVSANKKMVPEATLYFLPTDPKEGQKIKATAFPVYFSGQTNTLYYTWYIFHQDCDANTCDYNNDNRYDYRDWKIEAARIIASNGFDPESASTATADDNDGYQAKFGGDGKVNVPDHCYISEASTGKNYEFVQSASDLTSTCTGKLVCLVGQGYISTSTGSSGTSTGTGTTDSGTGATTSDSSSTSSGNAFGTGDTNQCYATGTPVCSGGSLRCASGIVSCLPAGTETTGVISCAGNPAMSDLSCSGGSVGSSNPYCRHLFPNAPGATSGDGVFNTAEENYWGTDPHDPSTANNGNKDEANVVGMGQSAFSWTYTPGDKVGVAIEGTSMNQTKYGDSSSMIMWAFPKKKCSLDDFRGRAGVSTGTFTKKIKGYDVVFPSVSGIDLNDCISWNLVDPTESITDANLDIALIVSPDSPVNDATGENGGDTLTAQASVNNAHKGLTDIAFEWDVYLSNNPRFISTGTGNRVVNATETLRNMGLLGNTTGNALDSVSVKLNIPATMLRHPDMFGNDIPETIYIKFSVKATESLSGGASRKGRTDAITKFMTTDRKINAYVAQPDEDGSGRTFVTIAGDPICTGLNGSDRLDRRLCRILKNEVIGLRFVPADGLSDFRWTINGSPLTCSKSVSTLCDTDRQNEINFFPVTGNVGDTYTVTVSANNTALGRTVSLSRTFNVIEPIAEIVSRNEAAVWPKLLGQYKDITGAATGCTNGLCNDFSKNVFQSMSGETATFGARFIPSFIGTVAQREWSVDGAAVAETSPGQISFGLSKPASSIYNVNLNLLYSQSDGIRKALYDIWNVSPLDSPEFRFSSAVQIELADTEAVAQSGPRKYLAALASYLPSSVIFAFRMILSAALILFTTGFLFALVPEHAFRRRD